MVLLIFYIALLLLALPTGEFSRVSLGLTISFTLLDILIVPTTLLWLGAQVMQKKKVVSFQAKTFVVVTGIFILSLLVNAFTLNHQQFFAAGLYIVRFFCYGVLFFIAKNTPVLRKKLSVLLLISGTLLLLSGYMQYFLYPSLRNLIYFGWDEHFYRMFGTFFDPNFFGLFLVLFFLFVLSKLFALNPQKQNLPFVSYFVLASAIFVGIFLTFSRTALLTLGCGVIVLFWHNHFWKWIVLGLLGIGMVGFVWWSLLPHATATNTLFRTTSSDARLGSAKDALTIFMDNPLIGVGFNAYRYAMYRHHFQPGTSIQEDHGASGADSSLLLVLATSGIVGLIAFFFFLWSHVRVLVKKRNKLGLATLISFFIGSFFVNGLFYPLLLVWVWTVLGIIEAAFINE